MAKRLWRGAALIVAAIIAAGPVQAEQKPQSKSRNPPNDELLKLPPPERASRLARAVGNWCIGTEAFPMGVLTSGPGEGNAYWSLRCADGSAWAVQIDPLAEVTAIGCDSFNQLAVGRECFKKF